MVVCIHCAYIVVRGGAWLVGTLILRDCREREREGGGMERALFLCGGGGGGGESIRNQEKDSGRKRDRSGERGGRDVRIRDMVYCSLVSLALHCIRNG